MEQCGYKCIYLPNHHRAHTNGTVYEHVVVAENMLGRELDDDEVIHHKDRNRSNNSPDNLMVFASTSDHTIFHSSGKCELVGDHYIGIKKDKTRRCELCGKEFIKTNTDQKYCSCECANYARQVNHGNIPTQDQLLDMISVESFESIGRQYHVSGNAVRKWCNKYGIQYVGMKKAIKFVV